MSKTFVGVVASLCVVFGALMLLLANRSQEPVAQDEIQRDPLTIAVSTLGRFSEGHSWYLSVNSAGKAELTILTPTADTLRQFDVSAEQMADLRKALVQERYFELAGEYGQLVPDGSETTISVSAGDQTKTVKLQYLMNWIGKDEAKLREPARALRILLLIRDWFDDANAVDLRPYHRKVVDAVDDGV